GSFAAGFVLIPLLGVSWTIALAALLNLAVAGGVMWLARHRANREPAVGGERHRAGKKSKKKHPAPEAASIEASVPEGWSRLLVVVLAGIGLSGVAAMTYQIAWTRVLALSIGSSVYAFSLILTAFIGGLALGSLLIAPFIDKRRHLVVGLGLTQGAIGLSALLIVPLLGELPVFITETVLDGSRSFQSIHAVEFAVIFGLILVPTSLMGAAVPIAVKLCTVAVARVGRSVGTVYAVNTGGAIVGSVATGFLLIPWVGTQTSIVLAAALNLVAAGLLLLHAPRVSLVRRVASTVVIAGLTVAVWSRTPDWNETILTSGPFLYAATYRDTSAQQQIALPEAMQRGRPTIFFKEGLHATVSVHNSSDGDVLLSVNGKTDATAKADAATQLMVGHLPLLLHPDPADVLVIGLGSGMTLGAVERHPVHTIDVVEIEAAVVEANKYFRAFTGDALADPRVTLRVADGRNHLALTDQTYDVIISEPSNPWISGMANLFTREFFALARARLRPGGVMSTWVHAYLMSSADFKTIVGTFQAVFPNVTVWEAAFGVDYLLLGLPPGATVDAERLAERLRDERLRADLGRMHIRDLAGFVNRLVLTGEAIDRYTDGVPLHTDDNALLEYSAPRALLEGRQIALLEELYRHYAPPAQMLRSLGWDGIAAEIDAASPGMFQAKQDVLGGYIDFERGATPETVTQLERALAASPQDYDATYLLAKLTHGLGQAYKNAQRLPEATEAYQQAVETVDRFIADDRVSLSDHFEMEVIYVLANIDLGVMAMQADRLEDAAAAFERSLTGGVQYAVAHNNLGIVYDRTGRLDAARDQYQHAIQLDPGLVSVLGSEHAFDLAIHPTIEVKGRVL
ncbi:MAG: fused MFS/spermidine synthase, partial [Acidobacteria bacterium]|nr:fused MFS/spermidine synthase [Acidobacteriota bacterium]